MGRTGKNDLYHPSILPVVSFQATVGGGAARDGKREGRGPAVSFS